jgi:Na+-translocating ferredoxin:NAD+ oxidoreductase RnfD subunit
MRIDTRRLGATLAGLWAGLIAGIALIGAPASFATLVPEMAGRAAGHMFMREAYFSLAVAVVLLLLVRRLARVDAEAGHGSVFSTEVVLVLGTLFCTMLGYFALQPMMTAARAGEGALSFGALHGISAALFGIKGLLALVLAWRLTHA